MINIRFIVFSIFFRICISFIHEGDDCSKLNKDAKGICINEEDCEYAQVGLRLHEKLIVCGFKNQAPLICCPDFNRTHQQMKTENVIPVGVVSALMCYEYFAKTSMRGCGTENMQCSAGGESCQFSSLHCAANGVPVKHYKEFSHMAAVGYEDNSNNIIWMCGGTLISVDFILTAAHCVMEMNFFRASSRWVRLGDLDLYNQTDNEKPWQMRIKEVLTHPDYKISSHYHDIALLKLEKPLSLYDMVYNPACLQLHKKIPVDILQAAGWGKTEFLGQRSNLLMKVDLNITKHQKCRKRYKNVSRRKLQHGIIKKTQICAGSSTGADTCPGDSGGPLHFKRHRTTDFREYFVVVGVTSFGIGCGFENTIGVYTRVSAYVKWIESIVWPSLIVWLAPRYRYLLTTFNQTVFYHDSPSFKDMSSSYIYK